VNVLFTFAVLALAAGWALIVIRRLTQLRVQVTLAWKRLEPDLTNDAIKTVYNKHVAIYNSALEAFPANVIAPVASFKPAKPHP
jgi:hypothetical protein